MALAAIPLLLERMLANLSPYWWITSYQYNASLVITLVFAAVDGAARLDRQWQARQHRAAGRERRPPAGAAPGGGGGHVGPRPGPPARPPAPPSPRAVAPRSGAPRSGAPPAVGPRSVAPGVAV